MLIFFQQRRKMKKREDYYEEDLYEEDELDLMDLVFTLFRRWKLIVLVAVPIIGMGTFFAMTRPTVYKSEMTLMVSNGKNYQASSLNENELSKNQKLAGTYAEIAKSKTILCNVIKKYDIDETLKNLQGQVTIAPVGNTEFLRLTYKNSDPQMAAAVTNEIGNEFMLKVRQVMNFQNIKVIESAQVPDTCLPKKRGLIIIMSIILGGMTGCGIAFIIEFFFCKLRKPKDIEKILGSSMLGMVPDFNMSLVEGGKKND